MHEKNINQTSTITCPMCGYRHKETMPINACQWFYECKKCSELLSPRKGDCCVFCSYGTVPCPPIQQGRKPCCSSSK
ncbi:GDCCVxC domain-containing (seleno)protein [Microbulbifer epialgicus]|uniref:GDCCVxC domain-containing (Seleno)protein n=1 Tax=Microbulbifer epialgicus TaxID=393907 RepID=A0ABV4P4Z3_9GAMM